MAIGSISGSSGYSTGGSSTSAKATDFFGGGATAASLFATNLAGSSGMTVDTQEIVVKGLQDQIDRLQGYRTNLTVAEKQQLAKHQETITNISEIATGRLLTADELEERADAYLAAYEILGKEYQDFSDDTFMSTKSSELEELIATKPVGAEADRLERLEAAYTNLKAKATDRDTDPPATLVAQISSINKQIAQLTTPRPMSSLKPEEIRQHDELVSEINEYAGYELELTSTKKLQIERLQDTIEQVQNGSGSGGGLFA